MGDRTPSFGRLYTLTLTLSLTLTLTVLLAYRSFLYGPHTKWMPFWRCSAALASEYSWSKIGCQSDTPHRWWWWLARHDRMNSVMPHSMSVYIACQSLGTSSALNVPVLLKQKRFQQVCKNNFSYDQIMNRSQKIVPYSRTTAKANAEG